MKVIANDLHQHGQNVIVPRITPHVFALLPYKVLIKQLFLVDNLHLSRLRTATAMAQQ